jgi:shikimate kinase
VSAATVTVIGLMGAGKTKVGRRAAETLGRTFVDTDVLVEQRVGKTVAAVFADDGEPAFRRLERAAVADAVADEGRVVAVGGGAPLDPVSAERMRAAGPVVWLYAEPATLAVRLRRSLERGDRPLLAGTRPVHVLTELLAARRAAYDAAATVRLRTDGLTVDDAATLLADWIRDHT